LSVGGEGAVLLRRARSSAFGKGGTRDGEGGVGVEKLTTDEARGKGLEVEAAPVSQDKTAGGISGSVAATVPGGDAPVGRGLV
jgi:hypothetical protein